MKKYAFLFAILLTSSAWGFFDPYQVYRANGFDFVLDSQYYKTTSNFDSGGEKAKLAFDNSFQIIDVNPQLRWGVMQDLGVRIGGNVGTSESVDPIDTRTNSTFNRLDVGADYLLLDYDSFQTILDFEYSHAMEKVEETTDAVLNNNGASEIKPTVIVRSQWGSFYPYGYLGGNFRSEGLSSLVTYGLGGEMRFSELGLGAAVKGFSSVKDDEFTNSSSRRTNVTSRVNAGSLKFYSVNPNSTAAEAFITFAMLDSVRVKFYGGADVMGSNTSQGFYAGGTLSWALDFGSGQSQRQTRPVRSQKVKSSDSQFKEDTEDGVDQNYFKPVNPGDDNYVRPIEEQPSSSVEPQNGTDSQIDPTQPSVQNDLDQLGYTIKLKKIKKKKKKKN